MRRGYLQMVGAPCDCKVGPCLKAPTDPVVLGAEVAYGEWSICPHGATRSPMLRAALDIDNQTQISPLNLWPDSYSAGVVDCLVALRLERAFEQRRQAEEQRA